MSYDSVMCDLETGDVDPARGVVLQIAAVKFNSVTLEVSPIFFDQCLNPNTQPNRRWEDSTRQFWSKRPETLQKIMQRMEPTERVLDAFTAWASTGMKFWAKPTHFDYSFLQSLYRDNNRQIPFFFRDATDMNSFARGRYYPETPPPWEKILPFTGAEHNALDDTLHQLKVLYKIFEGGQP